MSLFKRQIALDRISKKCFQTQRAILVDAVRSIIADDIAVKGVEYCPGVIAIRKDGTLIYDDSVKDGLRIEAYEDLPLEAMYTIFVFVKACYLKQKDEERDKRAFD